MNQRNYMEEHIMDSEKAEMLERKDRYRIISREEILGEIENGETVADIGSGTGFFTDDMAIKAEKVYGIDFQKGMHQYYREKGLPENVELIHSKASEIQINEVDTVFSIFSLHEISLEKSLKKFSDALKQDGKLFIVDWSKNAETEEIPPREELYSAEEASELISELFNVEKSVERYDTFLIKASK